MLSSIPIGMLVAGFIAISGRLARYSALAGVLSCTSWGIALGYTFSTNKMLAVLVDPGSYFLCLEWWLIFIFMQSMMTLIILGGANVVFRVRRS